jgi:hypothetical protein
LSVLALVGCGGEPWEDDAGDVEQVQSALTNGGVWMGDASGRLYTTSGGVSFEDIQSYHVYNAILNSNWQTKAPIRFDIVDWADWENRAARCGADAHARYGVASGTKWCTEYARWIMFQGGVRNIRYCLTHFIGCLDYVYLNEVDSVAKMVTMFSENGGWISEPNIRLADILPGDYLALTNSSGAKKSHSAIVMAVSFDGRWVYTSEGNVGDCVAFMRRPLFPNGTSAAIHPDIDGLGRMHVAF